MVNVYLADGFEEVEAITIVDILRRAGVDVKTVSVTGAPVVTGTHGIRVEADVLFANADHTACEMIVLPGGLPGATNLQEHKGLTEQLKAFAASGEKIAAICAAPGAFAAHGLLNGRKATIYPGMENLLTSGGAQPIDDDVVIDGNIITGRGPALAMPFALALAGELKGDAVKSEVAGGLLYR